MSLTETFSKPIAIVVVVVDALPQRNDRALFERTKELTKASGPKLLYARHEMEIMYILLGRHTTEPGCVERIFYSSAAVYGSHQWTKRVARRIRESLWCLGRRKTANQLRHCQDREYPYNSRDERRAPSSFSEELKRASFYDAFIIRSILTSLVAAIVYESGSDHATNERRLRLRIGPLWLLDVLMDLFVRTSLA
jgi:hypothetical protein